MKAYAPYYHILVLAVAACSGAKDSAGDDTGTPGSTTPAEPVCTEPVELTCVDEIIADMSLHDDKVATDREVTNEADGADYVTLIDATAGGFGNDTQNPWVYIRFTTEGAERIDIDDETALESMEWHLAARRFVLRLNGGTSGPSCVGAAAFLESDYEELDEVPSDLNYVYDNFYSDNCTIINDASGLPGSPQVALGPWWDYPNGCVATTEVPFLVQLEDGHVIKLRVEQYYTEQELCNEQGQVSTSGWIQLRWTFLR